MSSRARTRAQTEQSPDEQVIAILVRRLRHAEQRIAWYRTQLACQTWAALQAELRDEWDVDEQVKARVVDIPTQRSSVEQRSRIWA